MTEALAKLENYLQEPFRNKKLPFVGCHVVKITILRFQGVKVSTAHDILDTPDTYFELKCPLAKNIRKFMTTVKENQTSGEINEDFQFCIDDDQLFLPFPCHISLFDKDILTPDDFIDRVTVDLIKDFPPDKEIEKHFTFNEHGEVWVRFRKSVRTTPDFRYGLDLCDAEMEFRKTRLPKVAEAIRKLLGDSKGPSCPEEAPVISVIGSGGGYRAVIGMTGAMEALNESGITDAVTYVAGVSGSSWNLSTTYAHNYVGLSNQERLHKHLREALVYDVKDKLFSLANIKAYVDKFRKEKLLFRQPLSFVDYFGFCIGESLLGEHNLKQNLSEMQDYVKTGDVPLPLLVALHVKDDMPTCKFSVYMENSPFEVSFPSFGIGIPPSLCGSKWNRGFLARKCPEFPLHYYQGFCGCAFAVLITRYAITGGENTVKFIKYLESLQSPETAAMKSLEDKEKEEKFDFIPDFIKKSIMSLGFFTNRNDGIPRTGLLFNVARNLDTLPFYPLNPVAVPTTPAGPQQKEILKMFPKHSVTLTTVSEKVISIADAGIRSNVCTLSLLRPQRQADLLIIFDFNAYASDSAFDYKPLLQSAKEAWQEGLNFPDIDFKTIVNAPPKEYLVFEGETDDCPTVLWFTLCNTKFKELQNYKPRHPETVDSESTTPYNVFPVFDKGSNFSTFKFNYTEEDFDKLSDLMYFNVMSNIEDVKKHIETATAKRKRRLANINYEVGISYTDANTDIQFKIPQALKLPGKDKKPSGFCDIL